MIGFALCHGWAFDAHAMETFAHRLREHFPRAEIASFDLGFTGRPFAPSLPDADDSGRQWIAVGHSYGFAYLMQQPVPWRAMVSLNGFTRFCRQAGKPEGTPLRLLDAMLARMEIEPLSTVAEFRQRCGSTETLPQSLDTSLLHTHLKQLRDLDLPPPACPVLSLSCYDDAIVPTALTRACFGETARMKHDCAGSHVRLLQEPQACMAAIAEFVEADCG